MRSNLFAWRSGVAVWMAAGIVWMGALAGAAAAANPAAVAAAIGAQNRSTPGLMRLPGVVGTGVGVDEQGRPEIRVFTEFPGVGGIPVRIEGVPVRAEVTGMFVARLNSSPSDRWTRPVPIGVSTGHRQITAGTIGCRVVDGAGNLYALSNNHVYANSNNASVGDPAVLDDGDIMLQPGAYDGGVWPADGIGWLFDFEPIGFGGGNNVMDAAIAFVDCTDVASGTPPDGYGAPGVIPLAATVGLPVQKYGRTTGRTFGQVNAINVTVNVCYEARGPVRCVKLATFVNQISISPGSFSAGGDSGSLIVTDDDHRRPVGLLFAGSSVSTLANPIGAVLGRFGVTVDNSNGCDPGEVNEPPTVTITSPANGSVFVHGEIIDFTGSAMDFEDGVLSSELAWVSSLDGPIGNGGAVSAILQPGNHTITASVTDLGGLSGSASVVITVEAEEPPPGPGITLTANGYKVRGRQTVDLSWSGGSATTVTIYWNGTALATESNPGSYTHNINAVGGGSHHYQVCDGSTCSNEVLVTF